MFKGRELTSDVILSAMITETTALPDARRPAPPAVPATPATLAEALERLEVESSRRAQAEESLHESEERFRQFSERAGKFLWISDPETKELLYVSSGFEQIWTRTREGAYASSEQWVNSFQRLNHTGTLETKGREETYPVAGPDGSVRWIRDRLFPVRDAEGNVQRILGVAEDVTDGKLMHDALMQATARSKALLAVLPDLLARVRKDGTILEFHSGKDSHLAMTEAHVLGKKIMHVLPTALATEAMRHVNEALKTRKVQMFTCEFLLPDELRDFEARAAHCADDEVLVVIRDITERKRLEREIIEVSSREQQRIGEDLHDGLGQHLTGISFLTKALERKIAGKLPEEAKEAAEIARLVIQALAQTRNLARGLFPAELERNGLVAALQELTATVSRTCSVQCAVKAAEGIAVEDHVLATHIFRIAQEAINNSVKHAKAKNIQVVLMARPSEDRFELTVTDDGAGFCPEAKMEGLGLRIMHYRARRIGGALEVTTTENGGTQVTCLFGNKYESN